MIRGISQLIIWIFFVILNGVEDIPLLGKIYLPREKQEYARFFCINSVLQIVSVRPLEVVIVSYVAFLFLLYK